MPLISLVYLESEPVKQMSTAKALARLLELNMTQDTYLKQMKDVIDAGADIWLPYTHFKKFSSSSTKCFWASSFISLGNLINSVQKIDLKIEEQYRGVPKIKF